MLLRSLFWVALITLLGGITSLIQGLVSYRRCGSIRVEIYIPFFFSHRAFMISRARVVLPVPGSPLIRSVWPSSILKNSLISLGMCILTPLSETVWGALVTNAFLGS